MTRLRIGVIGCGEVAQIMHLPSLYQLDDLFTVTALCDVSNRVLQAVGDHWNVTNRYLDYRDLIAHADVDAVLVANPDAYHARAVLAAIAAGKHVLIEKPMCMTLQEADAIIETRGLKQMNDTGALERIIDEVVAANPDNVAQFKAGKDKAFNALVGQVMKASKGKANPQQATDLLRARLG